MGDPNNIVNKAGQTLGNIEKDIDDSIKIEINIFEKILKNFEVYILHLIFICIIGFSISLYLEYRCNNILSFKEFNSLNVVLAFCCWPFYIPYRLIVKCKK